jgi:hypothetical protein
MAVTQLVNKQGIYLFVQKKEEDSSNSCFYQKQDFFQVFPHFFGGVSPRP